MLMSIRIDQALSVHTCALDLRTHHLLVEHSNGRDAAIVGRVVEGSHVIMRTAIGGERFIEPPIGDPVPRVC